MNLGNDTNNIFNHTQDDTMGLDMLLGEKYRQPVSNKSISEDNSVSEEDDDDKTNVFNSSSDEDDDILSPKLQKRRSHETMPPMFRPPSMYNQQTMETSFSDIPTMPSKSIEEIEKEKADLLYQFDRLQKKGVRIPRQFTMDSSLEDMQNELRRIKADREMDTSVKFQRKMLMAFTSGLEFVNTKFDPFDIKLDGWSESLYDNIDDYDEIFEELHEKYKSKSKMAPELKLLMMMGSSAFMFHLTNTMFKTSLPEAADVLKQNPELMRQFAHATASTMASSGQDKTGMSGMFENMFQHQPPIPVGKMNGPKNMDSLLKDLDDPLNMHIETSRLETISTATPSEISDITDTNSISHLISGKRKTNKTTPMGKSLEI